MSGGVYQVYPVEIFLRKYFTNAMIYSIDVSNESIKAAEERNSGLDNVIFKVFDGACRLNAGFRHHPCRQCFHHILPGKQRECFKASSREIN